MITIGKLAGLTSVSNDTLRYYEAEGLIRPAGKSPAGYRLYDRDSARRIHFIKHAQQCGFTLAEIRNLLDLRSRDKACCGDVRTRAIEKADRKQDSGDESNVEGPRSTDLRVCERETAGQRMHDHRRAGASQRFEKGAVKYEGGDVL